MPAEVTGVRSDVSHAAIAERIDGVRELLALHITTSDGQFREVKDALARGGERFSAIEDKVSGMQLQLAEQKAVGELPPGLSWKLLIAVGLLAMLAGGGLVLGTITGVDILPKLQDIREAVE
ncbi:MAG: hypothetical protein ACRC56_11835 [Bosea sp. (in: a-proteobacteria)]